MEVLYSPAQCIGTQDPSGWMYCPSSSDLRRMWQMSQELSLNDLCAESHLFHDCYSRDWARDEAASHELRIDIG